MTSPRVDRCQALDMNGLRCKRMDGRLATYHGDPELCSFDGPRPTWVAVFLCSEHRRDTDMLYSEAAHIREWRKSAINPRNK